ncbi:MBL fold metallo-hydrolase [Parabacteroides bouchesdurhonensis]|uniref:MBL fold metallo-hydrolase n=1 Tax=Parabacteroides bouchesdurhonensis TaxID=1936995 RepID=UPI000E472BD6|nr:MBL fold metallo-hydrolase [Parabacteroides bouchesdurhonensis]RHJ93116.1 MBL fold metallo-hydrolase [Bacteroides sp. AM07-16]
MRLVYIYHSGFVVEAEGFSVLIDYYRDTATSSNGGFVHDDLLKRPEPLYVLSSHFHPDHFNPEVLTWKEQKNNIHYIFSKDILKHRRAKAEDAFYIQKGGIYQDDNLTIKAFGSTDVGVSFLMEIQGRTIFHAGDLNNWHWKDESTKEEANEAEKKYLHELDIIAKDTDRMDLVMFPVDPRLGTDFMRGAQQFIDKIQTKVFVPMHFWDRPAEVEVFAPYAESKGVRYVLLSVRGEGTDF